jgi:hypothetical protein
MIGIGGGVGRCRQTADLEYFWQNEDKAPVTSERMIIQCLP